MKETFKELQVISSVMGIPVEDILGRSRKAEIVEARHLAFYFLRKKYILSEIAEIIKRDHSSVVHGIKRIESFLSIGDKRITESVDEIKRKLKS